MFLGCFQWSRQNNDCLKYILYCIVFSDIPRDFTILIPILRYHALTLMYLRTRCQKPILYLAVRTDQISSRCWRDLQRIGYKSSVNRVYLSDPCLRWWNRYQRSIYRRCCRRENSFLKSRLPSPTWHWRSFNSSIANTQKNFSVTSLLPTKFESKKKFSIWPVSIPLFSVDFFFLLAHT